MKNKGYMLIIIAALVMIHVSGCGFLISQDKGPKPSPDSAVQPTPIGAEEAAMEDRTVTLYFGDAQAMYVVPEERTVKVAQNISENDFYKIVLEELVKGPRQENLSPTMPREVRILNVERDSDVLFVDFSEEMHTKHTGGAAGEDMTITSLANTMTELQGINRIMPTVNGSVMSIEHMVVEEPLSRMEDRIFRP